MDLLQDLGQFFLVLAEQLRLDRCNSRMRPLQLQQLGRNSDSSTTPRSSYELMLMARACYRSKAFRPILESQSQICHHSLISK